MWDGDHLWTLGRLVAILGSRADRSRFTIVDNPDLDLAGSAASQTVLAWAKRKARISAERVKTVCDGVQVIDGEVHGYEPAASIPWIVLRAIDSTSWEVSTQDDGVLAQLRDVMTEMVEA
jgi:hypothetical protein